MDMPKDQPRELTFLVGPPSEGRYVRLRLDLCGGCGDCAELCPVDAVRLDDQNRPSIDGEECLCCGICFQWCPESAIVMPAGWHRCD
jgi:heterodisulfide reductase subunit A-like polyferredoxin